MNVICFWEDVHRNYGAYSQINAVRALFKEGEEEKTPLFNTIKLFNTHKVLAYLTLGEKTSLLTSMYGSQGDPGSKHHLPTRGSLTQCKRSRILTHHLFLVNDMNSSLFSPHTESVQSQVTCS